LTLTRYIVRIVIMKKKTTQKPDLRWCQRNLREDERRKKTDRSTGLEAFGTRGYAKTNIKMICGVAGLTERYFYESFRHKEDLCVPYYRELDRRRAARFHAALEDSDGFPWENSLAGAKDVLSTVSARSRRAQIQLF